MNLRKLNGLADAEIDDESGEVNFFKLKFPDYKSLQKNLDEWCMLNYVQLCKRNCPKIKLKLDNSNAYDVEHRVYESLYLTCIHYGEPRVSKTFNSAHPRPNQTYNACGCKCFFHYKWYDGSFYLYNYKKEHRNHPETKEHWESHPNQRKFTEKERADIEKLFNLNVTSQNINRTEVRDTISARRNPNFPQGKDVETLRNNHRINTLKTKVSQVAGNIFPDSILTQYNSSSSNNISSQMVDSVKSRKQNINQKYNSLKLVFDQISALLCLSGQKEFDDNLAFFEKYLEVLRLNHGIIGQQSNSSPPDPALRPTTSNSPINSSTAALNFSEEFTDNSIKEEIDDHNERQQTTNEYNQHQDYLNQGNHGNDGQVNDGLMIFNNFCDATSFELFTNTGSAYNIDSLKSKSADINNPNDKINLNKTDIAGRNGTDFNKNKKQKLDQKSSFSLVSEDSSNSIK